MCARGCQCVAMCGHESAPNVAQAFTLNTAYASLSVFPYVCDDAGPCVQGKPPFTVADLKKAIPAHCFHRSLLCSFSYLALDLSVAAALLFATQFFDHPILDSYQPYASWVLWGAYIVAQGWVCTGVWVIAHECGHGAFSDSPVVNDTVGMALHTALLVPYFAWSVKSAHRL